ncbi:MAG: LCP family protein [Propionibacteriaceae bacterium]|jgi:LCP family protein required for cell wall assembly|nr:LCP family protein [Propionibacteriaceae bacterium]
MKATPSRAFIDEDSGKVLRAETGPRKGRAVKIVLVSLLAVVLIVGGTGTYIFFSLQSGLGGGQVKVPGPRPTTQGPTSEVSNPGDPYAGRALNILVMGTDSREGGNVEISADDDLIFGRSDTTFIAHISGDRTRVEIVSFPRDARVRVAECEDGDGDIIYASWATVKFNEVFFYGWEQGGSQATGVACLIKTVESLTDVYIDAYLMVDFAGFVDVVNAVGGVNVNLLCPIYSENAGGLDLPAGVSKLDGWHAVQLARARTGDGLGDGTDIARIQRQQALVKALIQTVMDLNLVTDLSKLYDFVKKALASVTTDLGGNKLLDLAGFAFSLRHFNTDAIYGMTVPWHYVEEGGVVLNEWEALPIWEALKNDQLLPGEEALPPVDPTQSTVPTTPGATNTGGGLGPTSTPTSPIMRPPVTIQTEADCEIW